MESRWWLRGVVPVPGGHTGIQSLDLLALLGILTLRLLPRWRQLVKQRVDLVNRQNDRPTVRHSAAPQHKSSVVSFCVGFKLPGPLRPPTSPQRRNRLGESVPHDI